MERKKTTPDSIQPVPKKKTEVPKTEISQSQDKSARNYIILMIVIIVGIILVGGYVIYRLATQFAHQSNLNRAQDMLISALNTKQTNLNSLKPNFEAINAAGAGGISDAERILSAMPITQAYDNLIATLESMGAQSGVKVTSVSNASVGGAPAEGEGGSQTGGIPFTFTVNVEGSYSSIIAFLEKTQQSARVINFDSMTVSGGSSGSEGSGSSGNLTANITMTTYYQPDANIESTFKPLE